jgi:hypothetical protein
MPTPGHSKASRAYLDWYRVTQFVGSYGIDFARDSVEAPTIEGDAKTMVPGKCGWSGNLSGWLDPAAGSWDEIEFGWQDADQHLFAVCPQGNTIGSLVYDGEVQSTGGGRPYDQASILSFADTWQGDGKFLRGLVGTTGEKAFTGAASDTGVNHGATTTQTVIVYIRCTAYATLTDITLNLDGSSDDGSADAYAPITGWTITTSGATAVAGSDVVVFSGLGWAKLTLTGATEAWKRLTCSAVTGSGSASFIMTVGLAAT